MAQPRWDTSRSPACPYSGRSHQLARMDLCDRATGENARDGDYIPVAHLCHWSCRECGWTTDIARCGPFAIDTK